MKKIISILFISIFLFGCVQQEQSENNLTIYTYDSMVSEYGLGPKVISKFEEQCNCKVNLLSKGDAGQVLTAIILEKDSPKADVVIGIDNSLVSNAIDTGLFEQFTPNNIEIVPENLRFDKEGYFTPFDYGFFAFVYDSKKLDLDFKNFNSLLDSKLRNSVVIQNPRTSSPGLGLLLWSVSVYGDPGYKDFWKEFKPNILTVTTGWDESAGLFSVGETPIYLSYATSPPYYVEFEDINYFIAANFSEGHYIQIESMAIVKGTKNRLLAEEFIEFSLEKEFQKEIPFTQFMFPINQSVSLPDAFDYAVHPTKQLELSSNLVKEKQEEWISEWEKIMVSG